MCVLRLYPFHGRNSLDDEGLEKIANAHVVLLFCQIELFEGNWEKNGREFKKNKKGGGGQDRWHT